MELYSLNEAFYIRQSMNPLSAGQIALWHAIVRVANKSHWQEWFSVANITLVQLSGLSLAGVKQARNALKQRGLIDFKPNGTKATQYLVRDIAAEDMKESSRVCSQNSSQNSSRNSSRNSSPLLNNTESDTPPTPSKGEERFSVFWKAYPRKVGKEAAKKAFLKLKVTDSQLEAMLTAIEAQKHCSQWVRDGGQYIPHPTTWLNQGRWEDEFTVPFEPDPMEEVPPPSFTTWEALYG